MGGLYDFYHHLATCIDENGENTQFIGLDMNKIHFKL